MKKVLNEKQLARLVRHCVKESINEYFYFDDPVNPSNDGSHGEDVTYEDSMETMDKTQAYGDIQWLCKKCHLTFCDLESKDGPGIFAVACGLDSNGNPQGNIAEFRKTIGFYEKEGKIKELGGGISKRGRWYRKYQITANLSEDNSDQTRRMLTKNIKHEPEDNAYNFSPEEMSDLYDKIKGGWED